ncbi:hypothetical protein FGB62_8g122 [Gracilaria domingensis]|nr:hypothetical protein FGB62_8g122 [Gracilaria domingensis]
MEVVASASVGNYQAQKFAATLMGGAVVSDCRCICRGRKAKGGKVCCSVPEGNITTSTACACNCMADATVLSKGECPIKTPAPKQPVPPVGCPRIYAPVCCESKYGKETAPNKCECLRAGSTVLYEGEYGLRTVPNECECHCDPDNDVISAGKCEDVPKPPLNATTSSANVTAPTSNFTALPSNLTASPSNLTASPSNLTALPSNITAPVSNVTEPLASPRHRTNVNVSRSAPRFCMKGNVWHAHVLGSTHRYVATQDLVVVLSQTYVNVFVTLVMRWSLKENVDVMK